MSMKTTFKIVSISGTYSVEDNGKIVAQGFPTREMALHGLWAYMGKVASSHYLCQNDGTVVLEQEGVLK